MAPQVERMSFRQPFDRTVPLLDAETPTFLGVPAARSARDLEGADAVILGIAYAMPELPTGAELVPRHLRVASAKFRGGYLPEMDLDPLGALRVLDRGDLAADSPDPHAASEHAQRAVAEIVAAGAIPITIGGNAPAASYACLRAIAGAAPGEVGVVNLDEHGDNREEYLGSRLNAFTWVARSLEVPDVRPAHWAQVGMRGPGNVREQRHWFRDRGVRVFTASDHQKLGTEGLIRAALAIAAEGTRGIWFAVDFDVLDTSAVPGWSYPDPLGLSARDLLRFSYEVGNAQPPPLGYSLMGLPAGSEPALWLACWSIVYLLAGLCHRRGVTG